MKPASSPTARAQGFTLIDVLVLITLVGLVAGAMTLVFTGMAKHSAEVMRTRQAISVAQALLNEIRLMPFTTFDLKTAGATAVLEAVGPELGEVRYHTAATNLDTRFDNPNDYNGLAQPGPGCAGICDIQGTVLNPPGSALNGCSSNVTVAPQAMTGIPNADALLISVTVSCLGIDPITLQGIRTRYAPNTFSG